MNTAEKLEKVTNATQQLREWESHIKGDTALIFISETIGKGFTDYYKVHLFFLDEMGRIQRTHLTWAIAQVSGYALKDLGGAWHLAISGGGFDKRYEIARLLEDFYGIAYLRYGRI
jgi:hypothetical protein